MARIISIDDLTGIPKDIRRIAVRSLDDLMTFRDKNGRLSPLINGYNWYTNVPMFNRIAIFSHVHETEDYEKAMLGDLVILGYDKTTILQCLRDKGASHLWNPMYRTKDDEGNLFRVSIKDTRNDQVIHLENYAKKLEEYAEFKDAYGYLIASEQGWQLDIPFTSNDELLRIVGVFLRKSAERLITKEGIRIEETEEEKERRGPWPDAYEIPLLIIGESAVRYKGRLPDFDEVTRLSLITHGNEISFIIHKKLKQFKRLPAYKQLRELGL